MRLVRASWSYQTKIDGPEMLRRIERAGRVCYKSEAKITPESSIAFVRKIIASGHESVLEHESFSVLFVVDRGVSHEMITHRLCSKSQESTRYCNYKGGVTFVIPPWLDLPEVDIDEEASIHDLSRDELFVIDETERNTPAGLWLKAMDSSELQYLRLLQSGWSPQQARSVLPNSLKTEVYLTANLREWRHILRLRTAVGAHPQMREVMVPLLQSLHREIPVVFDDIEVKKP